MEISTNDENPDYESIYLQCQQDLEKLKFEEKTLLDDLNAMLSQKTYIESKINEISKVIPTLKVMKQNAEELVSTVNEISESSEKISGKIRTLDTVRNRVDECMLRVNDLIDLEVCSQGVQAAILDMDYEKGAAHIHRFLSMDQTLLQRTANDMDNVSNMLKSVRTLQDATAQLRAIVEHKFTEAVNNEDLALIEKFFKIFPLLGMHAEGVREFCTYLRTKVAETADKNLKSAMTMPLADKRHAIIYADTLTFLFEGLARIIDSHQPLLETYYGPGKMLPTVDILQKECDKQVKRLLSEWMKARKLKEKLQVITDLSRMNPTASFGKLEKIDPKDLDILIGETTLMHFRCELYIKFINRKVAADIEISTPDAVQKEKSLKLLEQLIVNSDLSQCKHELLSYYLKFEQYFMEESVIKAINMDCLDPSQQISSMVDDTFFIVRKCIRRSISTGSLDGICVIINNACRVLENNFCDNLKMRLKQGYPSGYLDLTQAYNVLQTSIQQGRLQSGDTEQARTAFIMALNNADTSTEYVEALCDSILKEIESAWPRMNPNQRGKLESCLSGLSSVVVNLKSIINYGMQQLGSTAIKPRITPWVDSFLNYSHDLTEDELSEYEAGESFAQTLIMNLETLLSSFRDILTPSNHENFTEVLTTEVTQRMEKAVMKSTFNRLGGLVLDKEIRSLSGYITAATNFSVRDKFARLSQIATVLNLEQVSEIYDYWGDHDGALTWRLTPTEIKNIMKLRSDLRQEEIKRLKL
ncbi:conserved oligomeric Golgi complex subunit 4 [Cylas formicarius]|uniref:conserved oligomeric Golgi complex subunit 4 n=1 Tax=Cylas formicarius TaxID=197179 RepID=UPI0029589F53|nr:conserved oligomeric Golgi complex subunit 4 [Cylas formicarius]